jgi:hypothetical protein
MARPFQDDGSRQLAARLPCDFDISRNGLPGEIVDMTGVIRTGMGCQARDPNGAGTTV